MELFYFILIYYSCEKHMKICFKQEKETFPEVKERKGGH